MSTGALLSHNQMFFPYASADQFSYEFLKWALCSSQNFSIWILFHTLSCKFQLPCFSGFLALSCQLMDQAARSAWVLPLHAPAQKFSQAVRWGIHGAYVFVWCPEFCFLFFCFLFFFVFSRAAIAAYEASQARSLIRAIVVGLQSHSNARSKPHLQPIPQLTATLDP